MRAGIVSSELLISAIAVSAHSVNLVCSSIIFLPLSAFVQKLS